MAPVKFNPKVMDIFKGQRRTDAGTKARAGVKYFQGDSQSYFEHGYRAVKGLNVKKAVLRFKGTQRQIASCILRLVLRANKSVSRGELVSSTFALMATKNPKITKLDVLEVFLEMGKSDGIIAAHGKRITPPVKK